MTSEDYWASTMREYDARVKAWNHAQERQRYMAASLQATLYNAHFETHGVPFTAEDLMGTGDRESRKKLALRDKFETLRLQRQIAMTDPRDTEGLPQWAMELGKSKGLIN